MAYKIPECLPLIGGTITGSLSLNASKSSGLDLIINNSSTSSGAYARLFLQTLQASGNDPYITFLLGGSPNVPFSIGLDSTDDNFKMTRGFALGTADFQINTTTGIVSLGSPLPLASGGTNANLTATNGAVAYSTSSALAFSAVGSSGQLFRSTGAGTPGWTTATYPSTATSAGTTLRADGTNWSVSTTTYPDTNAINTIPYASSANVFGSIAAQNNGVLQTSASGVPSLSTTQTYSPTIGDGTNNFTTSAASGWYYRVGARTFVNINITWTGKGSASSGATVRISLPITSNVAPGANCFSIGFINGVTSTTGAPLAFCNGGDNYIQLINFVSGSSGSSVLVSGVGTSGQLQLAGWIGS
jgi:hypothetical protein